MIAKVTNNECRIRKFLEYCAAYLLELIFKIINKIRQGKIMLKWLLITSITLVSTTLLMFVSAQYAIYKQASRYYEVSVEKVILLSYSFNLFYLIISPLIFPFLKKHYSNIVKIATFLISIGCVGRYLAGQDYNWALAMSVLVGIAHVPIITAPYGLLAMFQPSQRGYASSIPLFMPALGINFCILYGMNYIVDQPQITKVQQLQNINWLNFLIAFIAALSSFLTLLFMTLLQKQIEVHNEKSQDAKNVKTFSDSIKSEFNNFKSFLITALCWGTILGINWSYGSLFGLFMDDTGLSPKEVALIGLYANLSSALLSNLGNWISNTFRFSNTSIIFYLNVVGFLASVFIQASVTLPQPIFHDKNVLIIAIILLRAGFSSFVSLSLIELSKFGPSVLVSSVFFYIANATNLGSAYIVTLASSPVSLGLFSLTIWACILVVFLLKKKVGRKVEMIELTNEEISRRQTEQELGSVNKSGIVPEKI